MGDPKVRGDLRARINADPYDQAARLVLADWYEENAGDNPRYDDLAAEQRAWTPEWQRAKEWLEKYAVQLKPYEDRGEAFGNLISDLEDGELLGHGTDLHSLADLDDADELRANAEVYLRRPIAGWDDFGFSCSC